MSYKHSLINTDTGVLILPRVEDLDLANLGVPDVRAESVGAKFPIGTALITDDGVYRYAKCGGVAVTIGKLLQQAAIDTNDDADVAVVVDATTGLAPAVGDTKVSITTPTGGFTKDQYKDGFMYVNDADGEGARYKIKSHPVLTAAATGVVTLVDAIEVALTTSSKVGFVKNLYDGVIVNPILPTGIPVGVVNISSFTASYYAWIKTKGITAVLTNSTLILGIPVATGLTTAGSVDVCDNAGTDEVKVGICMAVGATTQYSLVKIDLDPSW